MPVISALSKYGLLERSGEGLRLSDNALKIIAERPGTAGRVEALRRAAEAPTLFGELAKAYPGDTVPSPETLESDLIQRGLRERLRPGQFSLSRHLGACIVRGCGL